MNVGPGENNKAGENQNASGGTINEFWKLAPNDGSYAYWISGKFMYNYNSFNYDVIHYSHFFSIFTLLFVFKVIIIYFSEFYANVKIQQFAEAFYHFIAVIYFLLLLYSNVL